VVPGPKPDGLLSVADALQLSRRQSKENHHTYVNASLTMMLGLLNFDRRFVRAEGVSVWDSEGNEYIDCLGGYGALNLGHNHPKVIAAIEQVKQLPNLLQASLGPMAGILARNLALITPGNLQRSFFGNSGAESVEGALKLARAATGRPEFIYCTNSFHGKSFGALSITGREKYQKPFHPLLPGCLAVPYGDLAALENRLKGKKAAAFIVEPIQGEGGIILPPPGYLPEARKLCIDHGTLLIFDEIQTGMGRTGEMFACQQENVVPDIMCLAKSLGGGVMPVGAYITTDSIWKKAYGHMEKAILHTSTFGGNTWATAAAVATINVLYEENLPAQAKEKGNYLMNKLNELRNRYPLIKEVRGRGLLIGIEFNQPGGIASKLSLGLVDKVSKEYLGALVASELLNKYRIITAYTLNNPNVIRLEPPLTISYRQIDTLAGALAEIMAKHKGFLSMAAAGAKTAIQSFKDKR
jgi:putrescine aminotransferase